MILALRHVISYPLIVIRWVTDNDSESAKEKGSSMSGTDND